MSSRVGNFGNDASITSPPSTLTRRLSVSVVKGAKPPAYPSEGRGVVSAATMGMSDSVESERVSAVWSLYAGDVPGAFDTSAAYRSAWFLL